MNETQPNNPAPEFEAASQVFGGEPPPERGVGMPTLPPIQATPRAHPNTNPTIDLRDEPAPSPPKAPKSPAAPRAKSKPKSNKQDQTQLARVAVLISDDDLTASQAEADALDLFHIGYVRASLAIFAADIKAPTEGLYGRKRSTRKTDRTRAFRLRSVDLKHLDTAVNRTNQTRSWVIRECLQQAIQNRSRVEAFLDSTST